jgi:hypothetical protein
MSIYHNTSDYKVTRKRIVYRYIQITVQNIYLSQVHTNHSTEHISLTSTFKSQHITYISYRYIQITSQNIYFVLGAYTEWSMVVGITLCMGMMEWAPSYTQGPCIFMCTNYVACRKSNVIM